MAEYIPREVLLAQLRAMESYNASPMYRRGYDDCVEAILKTPSADVVPVVHCRDCKHFNHENMECENEAVSTDHEGGAQYSLNFELDDFCSYGERKDGGADNE